MNPDRTEDKMKTQLVFLREAFTGKLIDTKLVKVTPNNQRDIENFQKRNGQTVSIVFDGLAVDVYNRVWFENQSEAQE